MLLTTKTVSTLSVEGLSEAIKQHRLTIEDELSINLTDGTSAVLVPLGYDKATGGIVFNFKDCTSYYFLLISVCIT